MVQPQIHQTSKGDGPRDVLAIHCTLAHSGAWRGLLREMEGEITLHAIDLPSHGRSADWHEDQGDFQDVSAAGARAVFDRPMEFRFLKGQPWNQREPNASTMSKAQIIELLEGAFDEVIKTMNGLSETALLEPGKNFGSPPLNKEQSLLFMFDHITNHRAKAVLYLRMNKIRPPAYGFN